MTDQHKPQLHETGFLRVRDVLQFIPIGKSTWWAGVKTGRFPKSIKLGKRITVWKAEDITALIERLSQS